jgi:hypothetical protein
VSRALTNHNRVFGHYGSVSLPSQADNRGFGHYRVKTERLSAGPSRLDGRERPSSQYSHIASSLHNLPYFQRNSSKTSLRSHKCEGSLSL